MTSSMPVHPTSQSMAQRQPPSTQSPYHQQREEHEPYRGNNNREGTRFEAPYLTAGGRRGSDGRLLKSNTFVGRLPSQERPSSSDSGFGEMGAGVGGSGGPKAPSRRATTMTHKRTGPVGAFLEERKEEATALNGAELALALVPQHQPSEILSPEEGPPAAAMPLAERVAWLRRHHAPDRCYRFFIERRRDGLKSARYRAFTDGAKLDSPSRLSGVTAPQNSSPSPSKRGVSSSATSAAATQKKPDRGARRSSRNLMPKPGGQTIAQPINGSFRRARQRRHR